MIAIIGKGVRYN